MSSRWSDVGRGLVATVGLMALVAGIPAALVIWIGWPLPAEVPQLEQVTDALRDTYIPDEFLIKALAVVCWLIWVELMVSLVVEVVAFAHGRQAGRVPLAASGIQRAAARLVATAALLGALTATRGVPDLASRALHPPPTSNLVVAGDLADPAAEPDAAAGEAGLPGPAAHPIYVVQPRDTLWRIAECHLGDPFRWTEIYELNRGAPQPGGQVLRDADLIRPGWRLRLPPDATGLAPPDPAPAPSGVTAPTPALPASDAPLPRAPMTADAGTRDPAGAAHQGGMVLLDESDFARDGGRSPGTGTAGDHADDRTSPRRATGGGEADGGETGPNDGGRSGGDGGMVLLPDDAFPPNEPPADDGWVVARGDDE